MAMFPFDQAVLLLLFFFVALLYAGAGFGGGSSYLALLALWGVEVPVLRTTALLCNLVVVAGSSWLFWKSGHLQVRRVAVLCAFSIPCAFLGAAMPLKEQSFFLLLGGTLVLAAVLLFFQKMKEETTGTFPVPARRANVGCGLLGVLIGFLSGVVGIGGGIFLSPLLHFLRRGHAKGIAAVASFFILVNSVAGLAGQAWQQKGHFDLVFVLPLAAAVFAGGQIGSRITLFRLHAPQVRRLTALLVLYAGLNVLAQHW